MTTHGMTNTGSYRSWACMKSRCNNKNAANYKYYGGRGISYDESWESFLGFYNDMGERPHCKSLDRIDNEKGYSKENCKWSHPIEQANNTRVALSNPGERGKPKLTLRNEKLHKKLRLYAFKKGVPMYTVVEEAIIAYMKENK